MWNNTYIILFIYIFFLERVKCVLLIISFIFEVNNKWVHMYHIIVLLAASYAFLDNRWLLVEYFFDTLYLINFWFCIVV